MGTTCCDGMSLFNQWWALTESMGKPGLAEWQRTAMEIYFSISSVFSTEDLRSSGNPLSQEAKSMATPHSRVWLKVPRVNGDQKAYIQGHCYFAFGLSLTQCETRSVNTMVSCGKSHLRLSAPIALYLISLLLLCQASGHLISIRLIRACGSLETEMVLSFIFYMAKNSWLKYWINQGSFWQSFVCK